MQMNRTVRVLSGLALVGMLGGTVTGCTTTPSVQKPDSLAPVLGLKSTTHDGMVTLQWQASNYGENRTAFAIYRADGTLEASAPSEIPSSFGTAPLASLTTSQEAGTFTYDVTGLTNGTTYSFLVVASRKDGAETSRPSNIVSDTPRRQSTTVSLINGANSRYLDVAANPVVPSGSATGADILCQSFNAGFGDRSGMVGVNGARVQDLGWVANWDEIDKAPVGIGSYPDASYSVQVLDGHVYAVFTGDGHYAKVWISSLHTADFGYDCRVAYQPLSGSNELIPHITPRG